MHKTYSQLKGFSFFEKEGCGYSIDFGNKGDGELYFTTGVDLDFLFGSQMRGNGNGYGWCLTGNGTSDSEFFFNSVFLELANA